MSGRWCSPRTGAEAWRALDTAAGYRAVPWASVRECPLRNRQASGMIVVVITGPIASGKSTLGRALAVELTERGSDSGVVDLDLVYEMLDPSRGAKTDEARWSDARRLAGRSPPDLESNGRLSLLKASSEPMYSEPSSAMNCRTSGARALSPSLWISTRRGGGRWPIPRAEYQRTRTSWQRTIAHSARYDRTTETSCSTQEMSPSHSPLAQLPIGCCSPHSRKTWLGPASSRPSRVVKGALRVSQGGRERGLDRVVYAEVLVETGDLEGAVSLEPRRGE